MLHEPIVTNKIALLTAASLQTISNEQIVKQVQAQQINEMFNLSFKFYSQDLVNKINDSNYECSYINDKILWSEAITIFNMVFRILDYYVVFCSDTKNSYFPGAMIFK
jgi:hypothetical protein